MTGASTTGRCRDVKVLADPANGAGLDLAVAGDGGDPLALGSADCPHAVPGSLAQRLGAVSAQMTLELASRRDR